MKDGSTLLAILLTTLLINILLFKRRARIRIALVEVEGQKGVG
jgi:hypothetical protein